MGLLAFPGSGTLDFNYVGLRLGPTYDLRSMATEYNLSAPDVFPDDFYGKTYLETPGDFTTSSSSGVVTIGIIAYGSWTISENALWLSGISPASGTGTGTTIVNINKTSNTGSSRTGTVTLTLTATGETVSTIVTQQAGVSQTLTIFPTSYTAEGFGETFNIFISTAGNPTWTITDSATWISVSPTSGTGNATIAVTVDNNPLQSQRFGSVTVNWAGTNRTCSITQQAGGFQ